MCVKERLQIAVLANFTANSLSESLDFWLNELQIDGDLVYAPVDQTIQHLLEPSGIVAASAFTIVLVQIERWILEHDCIDSAQLLRNIGDLIGSIKIASRQADEASFVVGVCPHSPQLRRHTALSEAEATLSDGLLDCPGVDVVSTAHFLSLYPVHDYSSYFDPFTDRIAAVPYTRLCFAAIGAMVARRIRARRSVGRKVIAVDCDNSLWAGLCGEVAPTALVVTETHRTLQNFLIKQAEGGRLLCLASKNEEDRVMAVLDSHPGMILRREHLAGWKINRRPKPDNVRELSKELNVALDSFIFLDDDAFECGAMRSVLPQVLTLQLPSQAMEIKQLLRSTWEFDLRTPTPEDHKRILYYQQDADRQKSRQDGMSLTDFVESLELIVKIETLSLPDLERAAQLTQRASQFNLNSHPWTVRALQSLLANEDIGCSVVRARDRFGDYGLVGLAVFRPSEDALTIDTFLLSCRALGRGIEQQMVRWLAEIADASKIARLEFEYERTQRNVPLQMFLHQLGISLAEPPFDISVERCLSTTVGRTPSGSFHYLGSSTSVEPAIPGSRFEK
jgi:FkbH-like protein